MGRTLYRGASNQAMKVNRYIPPSELMLVAQKVKPDARVGVGWMARKDLSSVYLWRQRMFQHTGKPEK